MILRVSKKAGWSDCFRFVDRFRCHMVYIMYIVVPLYFQANNVVFFQKCFCVLLSFSIRLDFCCILEVVYGILIRLVTE